MSIKDYDNTVDFIEDNITTDKGALNDAAEKLLNVPGRDASEFFSCVEPEGRTLRKYIRDRKLYCALKDFIVDGLTSENVSEKYGISDASRFSTDIRVMVGKSPQKLRKEGYKVPEVKHMTDILDMEIVPRESGRNLSKEETDKYIAEIKRIRAENARLIKELKHVDQAAAKKADDFIEEMRQLVDENTSLKDELTRIKHGEIKRRMNTTEAPKSNEINKDEYMQFLRVEECRRQYGFTVEQILDLYRESLKTRKSLEIICDEALYDFRFEIEEMRAAIDEEYEIENLYYQNEYEMDNSEAFNYYFGDDSLDELDDDPYAAGNNDGYWEYYDDISPENRLEGEFVERVLETEREEKMWDEIEEAIIEMRKEEERCGEGVKKDDELPFA